jgi:hypothetical protein
MFRDSLREASDEVGECAVMLTRLTGSPSRGDLVHESLLVDVFLGWGRLVFDLGWIFTLIWVPLIMVPDTQSPPLAGQCSVDLCST